MKAEKTRKIFDNILNTNKVTLKVGVATSMPNMAYISNAKTELAELERLAEIGEATEKAFEDDLFMKLPYKMQDRHRVIDSTELLLERYEITRKTKP